MIPIYLVISTRIPQPYYNYSVEQILLVKEMNLEELDEYWKSEEYLRVANDRNNYGINVHFYAREVKSPFKNWQQVVSPATGFVVRDYYKNVMKDTAEEIEKETPEPDEDVVNYYDDVWEKR